MAERDTLEVDVLFVGAGPASLAGAIQLMQLAKASGKDLEVLVIDKAGEIGNHALSGAVVDPKALDELLPDWRGQAPMEAPVGDDQLLAAHERRPNQSADRTADAEQSRKIRRFAAKNRDVDGRAGGRSGRASVR